MNEEVVRRIAKIESTSLTIEPVMNAMLHVTYGGGMVQSIGGYVLDMWVPEIKDRRGTAYGCEWLRRVITACGVDEWEDVRGRTIYVVQNKSQTNLGSSGALGIEPLPTEPGEPFMFDELKHMVTDEEART